MVVCAKRHRFVARLVFKARIGSSLNPIMLISVIFAAALMNPIQSKSTPKAIFGLPLISPTNVTNSTSTTSIINTVFDDDIVEADCNENGRVMRIMVTRSRPIDMNNWKPQQNFRLVCRNQSISRVIHADGTGKRNHLRLNQ